MNLKKKKKKKKNNPNIKKEIFWVWALWGGGIGGCRVSEFYRESKSKKEKSGGGGGGGVEGGLGEGARVSDIYYLESKSKIKKMLLFFIWRGGGGGGGLGVAGIVFFLV